MLCISKDFYNIDERFLWKALFQFFHSYFSRIFRKSLVNSNFNFWIYREKYLQYTSIADKTETEITNCP